ncbi:MAG: hypothetical protein IT340_20185 [Chloroflexi bacterium]|nr:hypothetical protein [Chloroflexota bacterium]
MRWPGVFVACFRAIWWFTLSYTAAAALAGFIRHRLGEVISQQYLGEGDYLISVAPIRCGVDYATGPFLYFQAKASIQRVVDQDNDPGPPVKTPATIAIQQELPLDATAC